jgi:hypothetical protein
VSRPVTAVSRRPVLLPAIGAELRQVRGNILAPALEKGLDVAFFLARMTALARPAHREPPAEMA